MDINLHETLCVLKFWSLATFLHNINCCLNRPVQYYLPMVWKITNKTHQFKDIISMKNILVEAEMH